MGFRSRAARSTGTVPEVDRGALLVRGRHEAGEDGARLERPSARHPADALLLRVLRVDLLRVHAPEVPDEHLAGAGLGAGEPRAPQRERRLELRLLEVEDRSAEPLP